jgi:hypothetical protein
MFANADWFNSRDLTPEQLRSISPHQLRPCPMGKDGKYSQEAFVEYADSIYKVDYSDWSDQEKIDTEYYWDEYSKIGGLCDIVKDMHK